MLKAKPEVQSVPCSTGSKATGPGPGGRLPLTVRLPGSRPGWLPRPGCQWSQPTRHQRRVSIAPRRVLVTPVPPCRSDNAATQGPPSPRPLAASRAQAGRNFKFAAHPHGAQHALYELITCVQTYVTKWRNEMLMRRWSVLVKSESESCIRVVECTGKKNIKPEIVEWLGLER